MNFELSEEQAMLREMLSRYLREQYDFETRRARMTAGRGTDPALWSALAELGVLAALLPERAGGLGGGPVEAMVVMEALGEALAGEAFLETILIGAGLLAAIGGPAAEALLPRIADGSVRVAVLLDEAGADDIARRCALHAEPEGNGWRLSGHMPVVVGAPAATHMIAAATTPAGGRSLFLTEAGMPGIVIHPYQLIDERAAADLDLDLSLPADALLGTEGTAGPAIETVLAAARAALCAEAVGVLRRMLDDTVAYTAQRQQFGQPLARFQVLQHRMVDMYIALEQAISASHLATLHLGATPAVRARAIAAAKATIGRTARFIGENAVQLHGAMGMTDELAVGHYFKRATTIANQFGTTDQHVGRYAALMRAA